MDIKSKGVDVSSFFLFEATGDSEAGCFDPINPAAKDDDDAESCSSSDLLPGSVMELNYSLEDKLLANVGYDDHDHEDEEDGEVVDQKEVRFYKKWRDNDQCIRNGSSSVVAKETSVSVDSSTKTMSEMEKSRLFWEACLAS